MVSEIHDVLQTRGRTSYFVRRATEAAPYWISSASLVLHTKQSAANAYGQRDGRG